MAVMAQVDGKILITTIQVNFVLIPSEAGMLINYFNIDLCQALYHLEVLRVCFNTSCIDLIIASSLDAVISYKVLAVGYSLFYIMNS